MKFKLQLLTVLETLDKVDQICSTLYQNRSNPKIIFWDLKFGSCAKNSKLVNNWKLWTKYQRSFFSCILMTLEKSLFRVDQKWYMVDQIWSTLKLKFVQRGPEVEKKRNRAKTYFISLSKFSTKYLPNMLIFDNLIYLWLFIFFKMWVVALRLTLLIDEHTIFFFIHVAISALTSTIKIKCLIKHQFLNNQIFRNSRVKI